MASPKEESKETIVEVKESVAVNAVESFIEDPLAQVEDAYSKYKKPLNFVGSAILAVIVLFAGYKYYIGTQEEEANTQMFQAVYYFEADSLTKALNGDGNYPGLIEIADDYSLTPSGNLAKFYVGTAYLKQGKFEEAISYLKGFSSNDLLVQARAYSLIGDANMELKQYDEAVSFYNKASNYKPNKEFTPSYLLKLGLAQEKASQLEAALETYSTILDQYPNSAASNDAKRSKGVVESQLGM
jgi:tetratricopeptide (TPR) repeat protein